MRLHDKTAIVTGASAGIGRAAALLFAREGAHVVLGARRADALDAVVAEIAAAGGEAIALAGDVRDDAYAEALVAKAVGTYGRLDVGFNNAGGIGPMAAAVDTTAEDWRAMLDVNLTGAFYGAKRQIAAMLDQGGGGAILFTSSFVGQGAGFPGMAAYGASKAGLVGLTQCLAAELGAQGIRVNALLPGGTRTAMADNFAKTEEEIAAVAGLHALKRVAQPNEIAEAAAFLASDAASFVTGAAFAVDGGVGIQKV